MNGDLRYLRKDKRGGKTDLFNNGEDLGWKGLDEDRQNNFNDLLYKFGWKSMLSQNYGERKIKFYADVLMIQIIITMTICIYKDINQL